MAEETAAQVEPNYSAIIEDLKRQKGLDAEAYQGNQDVLARVRELEKVEAGQLQTISIASARGDEIERLALLDPLTELYNQRAFLKELKAELNRAKRYNQCVSLCILSADGLDQIKQTYGPLTFDAVQKVVSNVIRDSIREVDLAARYTADEFVIVFTQTQSAGAALSAERLRQRIGNQAIMHNWQTFSVTASAGVATFPQHAHAYDELIARAWESLEYARERGGDRVFCV
ncbi:MAG TPA: GGDEF domain-containing protein [Candidatus Obscuribacterales bacterium]